MPKEKLLMFCKWDINNEFTNVALYSVMEI